MPVDTGSPSTGFIIWGAALVFFMTPLGTHAFPHTAPQIPTVAFMVYHMQFAGIAAALVFSSVPERTRIVPGLIFVFFWTALVYDFIAYWTWADHGFLRNFSCLGEPDFLENPCFIGVYDFAGRGPIHVAAGFSGLAYVLVLGKRKVIHAEHHNLVNMMFGTGVLWFGNPATITLIKLPAAGVVTTISAAAGGLTWVWFDFIFTRKLSSFSFCSGVIAGLLGITPASGFVAPWAAIVIGALVSLGCYTSSRLKKRWGIDDSFDAGSLHGVGGFLGMVLTGVFAQKWITDLDGTPSRGGMIEGN
ncbi:hypothetical protein RvY_18370 [Ramazzottius varieornatus]|uniref:Ammonium transporter AmtB-like domain-containing protein n=1 Tax=Ramazzottius varieornatus TaxID=947166 RepID=A0A1D1W5Z6_RAMVA|nr:hypothetical protein RvY_18370 [Ramazzottius varieornatus]